MFIHLGFSAGKSARWLALAIPVLEEVGYFQNKFGTMLDTENLLELEDLLRRYDVQVLREYLLNQEQLRHHVGGSAGNTLHAFQGGGQSQENRFVPEERYDLRPRLARLMRILLTANFAAYWGTVFYCSCTYAFRLSEFGIKAALPLKTGLLAILCLSLQSITEFVLCVVLTRPVRQSGHQSGRCAGFVPWDGFAWLVGLSARSVILLDAQLLPLMWHTSGLLFTISASVFVFAIGIFVLTVQLRLLIGMYCEVDRFSFDKPHFFFKWVRGRTARMVAAAPEAVPFNHPAPSGTTQIVNCAHLCDFAMLHDVMIRFYIPLASREDQEFVASLASFSRCFCEDIVQCTLKLFFLLDFSFHPLVAFSLFLSMSQAFASCLYSTSLSVDIPQDEAEYYE